MGFFSSLFERRATSGGSFHPSSDLPSWWRSLFGGETNAGEEMDEWLALNLSTVYACVSAIAIDVARLPFHVYRRLDAGGKERTPEHPAFWLINEQANPEMNALDFWDTLQWWTLLWGNGPAWIERKGDGTPVALWPREPWRTRPLRVRGRIVYEYHEKNGGTKNYPAEDMLHLKAMGNGLVGMSIIGFARECLGAAAAVEKFGAKFFGNGTHVGGILEHPGKLTETASKNLAGSWKALYGGAENSHELAILEEGMKYIKTAIPPEEAQFLETRQFSIPEICKWFRMPPHKVQDYSRAHFNNIEAAALGYIDDTLSPWISRQEKEVNAKLLMPSQRATFYTERLIDARMRTTLLDRYKAHQLAILSGWRNRDEVRAIENENPIPDGKGKEFIVPMNMTTPEKLAADDEPADKTKDAKPEDEKPAGDEEGKRSRDAVRGLVAAQRPVLESVYRRALHVEADKVRRASGKPGFDDWSASFYEQHGRVLRSDLFPVVEALTESVRIALGQPIPKSPDGTARSLVEALADAHLASSRKELAGAGAIEARTADWDSKRAELQAVSHLAILEERLTKTWAKE